MSKPYLHTVKDVNFYMPGFGSLDVSSFSMTLTPGAIPMAQIGVALAGGSKGANRSGVTTINPLSLGTLQRNLNMLLEKASQAQECNIRMRLETKRLTDNKSGTQEILLKGWILVAAGLGSVTTTNGFSCMCTVAHPIYKLAMHGGFCTNLNESLKLENLVDKVTDPLKAGILVYKRVLESKSKLKLNSSEGSIKPGGKSPTDIMKDVEEVFKEIPTLLEKYLEWKPELGGGKDGLPFKSMMTEPTFKKATAMEMLNTWLPVGSNSVWDIFVKGVCSEFDLTVIPDYTKEKLPLTPYYPWISSTKYINEDDAFELVFPGIDPAPIYGLCSAEQTEMMADGYTGSWLKQIMESLDDKVTVLAYVPKTGAEVNGSFFTGAVPEWLSTVFQIAPGFSNQAVKTTSYAQDIPQQTASSGDNKPVALMNKLKMASLAQEFLKLYKKRLEATVSCPLLFSRNGEDPFLPGQVLSIKNQNGTLLQGYVVSVTHNIDMHSGQGLSQFHLAYCRPESGYEAVKDVLDKNPMYT